MDNWKESDRDRRFRETRVRLMGNKSQEKDEERPLGKQGSKKEYSARDQRELG